LERLCDLLFELSNEDRLHILMELRETSMKLSQVSKKLNLTIQETSRNLNRLNETKLIRRNADSTFNLTLYGEEALKLPTGYEFLSKNSEYFMNHTLSGLPLEFNERIGALLGCEFTNDVMTTFHYVDHMIGEAEEYLLFITEQILTSIIHAETEAVKRGVEVRALISTNISPPPGSERIFAREDENLEKGRVKRRPEVRYLDKVEVCLCMSEKEVAGICFPTLEGKLDHLEFRGLDERSRDWCKDLFEYYWKIAYTLVV